MEGVVVACDTEADLLQALEGGSGALLGPVIIGGGVGPGSGRGDYGRHRGKVRDRVGTHAELFFPGDDMGGEIGELLGVCDGDGKLDELVRRGEVVGADPEDVAVIRLSLGVDRFKAGRKPPMQATVGAVFVVRCHGK